MKLQELAAISPTKQAAKVFESYFGSTISFDQLNQKQARNMLIRVRGLIAEARRQPSFHTSEKNPSYMKMVVLEQALSSKLKEEMPVAPATPQDAARAASDAKQKINKIQDPKLKAAMTKSQSGQTLNPDEQKLVAGAAMAVAQESRQRSRLYYTLQESEVQQAQVVLASQDMVDQVQKMIEQVTAMQFKDLPALVDQVKNQVGVEQATQFNGDASSALGGLVQNLQASKLQLEQALGVVTGQASVVPGEELGAPEMDAGLDGEELPPELPAPGEEDIDLSAELEEPAPRGAELGRARR
jgi:hypothetical protein